MFHQNGLQTKFIFFVSGFSIFIDRPSLSFIRQPHVLKGLLYRKQCRKCMYALYHVGAFQGKVECMWVEME